MKKNILGWIIATIAILGISFFLYRYFMTPEEKTWYLTEKPTHRTIEQIIRATGTIEAEDTLKIGSIVPGVIRKLLAEENQVVKKGDLLATIDDGKDDTDVRATKAALQQAESNLAYMTNHYQRQKALYKAKQLSQDAFEKITRDYVVAQEAVAQRKAENDQATLIYNNKKIRSPENGLVIQKVSTEGETVTLASPATIIYTIAKDIRRMKVKLEVDENRIGEVKAGQTALLTFDTYPYKRFSGNIKEISNAAIKKNSAVSYEASFILDNEQLLLRPGMTVNARILVSEKEDILTVPGHVLAINNTILEQIAQLLNYQFKPLDKQKKRQLMQKGSYKTVWVKEGNTFIEKPIELGIDDNAYFEVISGLTGNENIISDIQEADSMQQLYDKIFGKGL